jgi:hypothetical protein
MSDWSSLSLGLKILVGCSCLPIGIIIYLIITNVPKFIYKLLNKNSK